VIKWKLLRSRRGNVMENNIEVTRRSTTISCDSLPLS
jgi:hypothetical protein